MLCSGWGCCRVVADRVGGPGMDPGIVLPVGSIVCVGIRTTEAGLRCSVWDLVLDDGAPSGRCDIVSDCLLCTAGVSWSLLCTQPLMFVHATR